MKKIVLCLVGFVVIAMMATSCAGYLTGGGGNSSVNSGDTEYNPLLLANGSFVSKADANDITPFVFRHNGNGLSRLFFASDRDGTGDIYCADIDGKIFRNLVRLGGTINTTNFAEVQPIVFESDGNIYITVSRITNNNLNQQFGYVITYQLDWDTLTASNDIQILPFEFTNTTVIPLLGYTTPKMIWNAPDANDYVREFHFIGGQWTIDSDCVIDANIVVTRGCGRKEIITGVTIFDWIGNNATIDGEFFIFQHRNSQNRWRINAGYYRNATINSGVTNVTEANAGFPICPEYAGVGRDYDDISPFIDERVEGHLKVYFASTRFKGLDGQNALFATKYDLYRYNEKTLDTLLSDKKDSSPTEPGIYVAPYGIGTNANHGTNANNPIISLQLALEKLTNYGYTNIYVMAGTYLPFVTNLLPAPPGTNHFGLNGGTGVAGVEILSMTNVRIIGGWNNDFNERGGYSILNRWEATAYDANVVSIENSQNIGLSRLDIMGGNVFNPGGAGVNMQNSDNCVIVNSTITFNSNNDVNDNGGGIRIYGNNNTIDNCTIAYNYCAPPVNGGGVWVQGNYNTIKANIISNTANGPGGGIYLYYATNTTINSTVFGNKANGGGNNGGGMYISGGSDNKIFGEIVNNTANDGGGIYLDNADNTTIMAWIHNNEAINNGGGIYVTGTSYTITGEIAYNVANKGGGIYIEALDTIISSWIHHNNALYQGGGIYIYNCSPAPTTDGIIENNTPDNITNDGGT